MTAAEYKAAREQLGTQAEVAAMLGVNRVTVAKRENGTMTITNEAVLAIQSLRRPRRVRKVRERLSSAMRDQMTSELARDVAAHSQQRMVGRHSWCVLYHADCKDVLPLACDAVVTDPPYGIGFAAQPTKWQRRAGKVAESWDNEPGEVDGLLELAPLVAIWGGNYYPLPLSRGWLVWHKPDAVPSMANAELAWTNQDRNTRQISWSISATNAERVGHPTQKPVRVMAWTLEQLGVPKGATVLDPYMGSGTTAIACIRLGMNFIGIERDAAHYKTACDRIAHELDGALL